MRIACLSWESLHSIRVGGLGTVATRLSEELAGRGHDVHIFTRADIDQTDYEFIDGVHYHRLKFAPGRNTIEYMGNMSRAMLERLDEVERYHGRFDVVHGHDWHVVDALDELKKKGRPIVLTFHSTAYGRNGNAFGDWWEFREISGKEWYGGYIANKVTTVSSAMKSELSWLYGMPPDKVEVVPNGIDPSKWGITIDAGSVKREYGIHPYAPVVLFIGRMTTQKGPDLLLRAVPMVLRNRWDVKFIFAGGGEMLGYLQGLAWQLGVEDATRFLGFATYWDAQTLMHACDIVCIPSRNEPFGLVLLEAWASGKPVVAADVGGLQENIDNFKDGIKVYTNPDSIAWGINYVLDKPEIVENLSKAGKARLKEFTWSRVANHIADIYRSVSRG